MRIGCTGIGGKDRVSSLSEALHSVRAYGNARQAEYRFGWGRQTIAQGLVERAFAPAEREAQTSNNRGKPRSEDQNPQQGEAGFGHRGISSIGS